MITKYTPTYETPQLKASTDKPQPFIKHTPSFNLFETEKKGKQDLSLNSILKSEKDTQAEAKGSAEPKEEPKKEKGAKKDLRYLRLLEELDQAIEEGRHVEWEKEPQLEEKRRFPSRRKGRKYE